MASAPWINQFNQQYLHSIDPKTGHYRRDDIFAAIGLKPDAKGVYQTRALTGAQRDAMKRIIEQQTGQDLGSIDVDENGNLNEPEGFGHYAKKYGIPAAIAAAAAFGIPAAIGAFGGSAGAGAGVAGAAFDAVPNIASAAGAANAAALGGAAGAA